MAVEPSEFHRLDFFRKVRLRAGGRPVSRDEVQGLAAYARWLDTGRGLSIRVLVVPATFLVAAMFMGSLTVVSATLAALMAAAYFALALWARARMERHISSWDERDARASEVPLVRLSDQEDS